MCLIYYKPQEVEFPEAAVRSSFIANNDGFGVMYAKNGRVRVYRIMPNNVTEVINLVERYKNLEMAGHMRFATSGEVNKKMCHPLKILRKEDDGADLYVMHNGVLSGLPTKNDKCSDTWHLAQLWLKPILKRAGPDIIQDEVFQQVWKKFIGTGNKLLFLDDVGRYTFINKEAGSDKAVEGCWVSNPGAVRTITHNNNPYGSGYYDSIWKNNNKKNTTVSTKIFYANAYGWKLPTTDEDEDIAKRLAEAEKEQGSGPHKYGDVTIEDVENFSYEDLCEFVLQQPDNTANLLYDMMLIDEGNS